MKYIDFIKYAITNNQYKEWHNNLTISISFIENIKYKHELIIFKDFTIVKVDLMEDFLVLPYFSFCLIPLYHSFKIFIFKFFPI